MTRHPAPAPGWSDVARFYAARVGGIALGVALSVLSARRLGPEGQGNFASLKTFVLLGAQVTNVGLSTALTLLFARRPSRVARYRHAFVVWPSTVFVALLLALVVASATRPVVEISTLWPLAILWIPVQLFFLHVVSAYVALQDTRALGMVEVGGRALALVAGLAVLGLFAPRVDTFASALVLADVVTAAIAVTFLARVAPPDRGGPTRVFPFLRAAMRLGLRAYPVLLIPFLLIRSDVLLVRFLRGAREAGIYSVAAQVIDISLVLPATISALVLPSLVRVARPEEGVRAAFRPTALVLLALAASVAAFGGPGVRLLFGAPYGESYLALLLLLPGFVCLGLESLLAQYFAAKGFPPFLAFSWLGAFALNVILNVVFVPRFGFLAAAASSSVCYAAIFGALFFRFRRETSMELGDLLRRRPHETLPS